MSSVKKTGVLVLNKSYVAIEIRDWPSAISLLFQGTAYALDMHYSRYDYNQWVEFSASSAAANEGFTFVNTTKARIAVPEIILLADYSGVPNGEVKYSRQTIFERDGFKCAYCGQHHKRDDLNIDHVIPRAQGGKSTWENTVASCYSCNSKKADRTPAQAGMKLLVKPKKPSWISPASRMAAHVTTNKSWGTFLDNALEQ